MITIDEQDKERLVKLIREVSEPERVFLLGRTMMKRKTESVFAAAMPTCHYVAHYYLLVLAGEKKKRMRYRSRSKAGANR